MLLNIHKCDNKYCNKLLCKSLINKKLQICNACKSVYYCNKKCQKQDWLKHKKICNFQNVRQFDSIQIDALNKLEKMLKLLS